MIAYGVNVLSYCFYFNRTIFWKDFRLYNIQEHEQFMQVDQESFVRKVKRHS
ncbi:MAG: hypothetical protein O7F74_02965 [Bacteroidetes bacterium]|nr:hypothetical protein [Bacteroidota bacterium]